MSCSSAVKTTASWIDKEKVPAEGVKSVFIIAFTDNIETRAYLENDLAAAAEKKGLKTYKSVDVVGPVEMKYIAPVKDVFMKKLGALHCETIFTVALIDQTSETRYVGGTVVYSPYPYGSYNGAGGYSAYNTYGGFGGYYDYAVTTVSSRGYYKTKNKYFLEAKMFDLKTEDLLVSIQTRADNPRDIQKASKQYTTAVVNEIEKLQRR